MVIIWYLDKQFKSEKLTSTNEHLLIDAMWIDLINPTKDEEILLENTLDVNIPTREEMREIELSSRLYKEDDTLFMTATMVAQSESITPNQDAVTFILSPKRLITVRYIEPQAFKLFATFAHKLQLNSPAEFLTELLDATIDRFADILEGINHQLEAFSKEIFQTHTHNTASYHNLLQQLGINGALNSKIVESLVSFTRLISFFDQSVESINNNHRARHISLTKDISSLNDYAQFISSKISFLLDATLGLIQIEQNSIIKIFSVAAVIFLPPTLIASIYGMNFHIIPELSWTYGYQFAIGLMLFAAWVPYKYFKYKKWL